MNTETKRHIDAARQVLVGVVPNPSSQIDQITNALVYKFMDDMDQAAIKAGGDPSFFTGELEPYAWSKLMDTRLGNQEKMNLYSDALIKFSNAPQLPELFRNIFKSAFLPYRSPETLGLFLKEINYFDYSHPEELGNAYEYLLSIMSSQGDAGQFRTPRHIIDFIVDVVNPTKDDKILDPACGTAGFLISSYKHILEQHDGKNDPDKKEKPLTPDDKKKMTNNFEGYDIDPGMTRIATVNMYLHQFKNPRIYQYDTLSSEERWGDKFDVILANPPFMSPKGGIIPHKKFSVQSNRSEVLFVDYIMNHLRPNGRAGIIVPEGIIFQSGTAHKQLRKNLVNDGLYAVVSLPSGVFNPYAGVKTSILLFNNDLARKSDEILFVKVENDGFDLGATKRPISKNDLPEALEILNKWKTGQKVESKLALYVDKTKIAEGGDYNLSGDRYRSSKDYSNIKWSIFDIENTCEIGDGNHSSNYPKSNEMVESGIPFIRGINLVNGTVSKKDMKYITVRKHEQLKKGHLKSGDVLFTNRGEIGKIAIVPPEFDNSNLNSQIAWLRPNKKILLSRFLFFVLNSPIIQEGLPQEGATLKQLTIKQLKALKFPVPPLEVQEQIVSELDSYNAIIAGARQIVDNWKPIIEIDPEWKTVKIGEVAKLMTGGTPSTSRKEYYENGTIKWLVSGDIHRGEVYDCAGRITEIALKESNARLLPVNSVLIALNGQGKTRGTVAILRTQATCNQSLVSIIPNNIDELLPEYLMYVLKNKYQEIRDINGDKQRGGLNMPLIRGITIHLPSIDIQREIVEKIESERALVESAKKLIEIYEQKSKKKIEEVWGI